MQGITIQRPTAQAQVSTTLKDRASALIERTRVAHESLKGQKSARKSWEETKYAGRFLSSWDR